MIFLLCFAIVTTTSPNQFSDNTRKLLLIISIILGSIQLCFEIRRFIWNPLKYITDFWNYLDIGAYSLPIITSILWLINKNPPPNQLISSSNLLLDLKFMLFLRVVKYFGVYFAIILGVAKKIFSEDFSVDEPKLSNDPNNPWSLVSKYYTFFSDGSYSQESFLVQQPDETTNMFAGIPSSILAMYSFLTGDNGAFAPWALQKDPYLTILVVIFSFIVVVYLMNLFIGLLGNEIGRYHNQEAFLAQKAKIITEIELFYLLPNQRRWRDWFPEILSYEVPVDDIRKKIKEIDDSHDDIEYLPFISDELRKLVNVFKPEEQNSSDIGIMEQIEKNLAIKIKKDLEKDLKEIKNQMQILIDEIKTLKK
ncbi:10477_t:CDS:2 [Entrophospora sp. SA101]|nr:10477_t:CDS:2 [Entrophospora sp. SA101]